VTRNKKARGQNPRVSPEFASDGLGAALAKKGGATTAAATPETDWTIFGVDTVAQMAAENAANRAGQSLGQWLSELIDETLAERK
jgi:hypothetical protein